MGQSLAKFKVIFDLFYFCFYFIQQQNYKVYYANLLIISEIQSKSAYWSRYSSNFKRPQILATRHIASITVLSVVYQGFSSNFGKRPLAKLGKK